MEGNDRQKWGQYEMASELADLIRVSQGVTQRLATETHGDLYDEVETLAELLHEARSRVGTIIHKLGAE